MMSTQMSTPPLTCAPLGDILDRMQAKLQDFVRLLHDERQAIRTLSFGQFTNVTERKSGLLEEIRVLESERRALTGPASADGEGIPQQIAHKEKRLADLIVETDRMNRFNADLIGQSLTFLTGSLRMWQQSPASAAIYSPTGSMVSHPGQGIGVKG